MRGVMKAAAGVAAMAGLVTLGGIAILDAAAAERKIAAAPAFNARALTELPRGNWITNGGNVLNQRYSPLTQLNRDTVKELKALWRTSMGSGALPGNSGQAQILHYEGVLYVINGANDVFGLDVDTGAILWTYHGNPDSKAGRNTMPPFGRAYTDADLKDVAGYIEDVLAAKK